jgi:hypothetical protein
LGALWDLILEREAVSFREDNRTGGRRVCYVDELQKRAMNGEQLSRDERVMFITLLWMDFKYEQARNEAGMAISIFPGDGEFFRLRDLLAPRL